MKQNESVTPKIQLKPYSKHELIELYQVSWKIIKGWLELHEEEIGARIGHFYTPKQMKIIFEKLGIPEPTEMS